MKIHMIRIKDLSISFAGNQLFSKANFNINAKEKIGLIGRTGTGKSTLFKLLNNQIEADSGFIEYSKNYHVGILEQHIKFTKDTIIDEVCTVLNADRQYEEWKGEKILSGLGFSEEEMLQDPNLFSGGFQIKINLAKLLLLEPNLLLLDEPTNYLDIHSIKWLRKFLSTWEREIILITHDRTFMDSIITHTLNIHRGNFRKVSGNTKKIKDQIEQEEIIHEKTRVNQEKNRKKTQEWIDRFKSKATLASRAQSRIKMLEKQDILEKLDDIDNLDFKFNYLNYNSKESLLESNSISFGYDDKKLLLNNFSTKVNKGDKICIIGKNGKGKSTLLKLLHNELLPHSGDIKIHSKSKIGYFGQMNIDRLSHNKTIYEEMQSVDDNIIETKVRRTCAHMMFPGDLADKKIAILSGGEKSRVMLGKILLKPVNMLFLDEPTNHLDMESTEALMNAVYEFTGSVLMVSHDEHFLNKIANKLIIYDNGKVFNFNGTYKEFCKNIGWKDL